MTSIRTKQRRIMEELDSYNFQQLHESPVRLVNKTVNPAVNEKLLEVDSLPLNKHDFNSEHIGFKVS